MSIYREWRLFKEWRRFFLDIEIQFAAGRNPKPDEYAADDVHLAPMYGLVNRPAYDAHPYSDPDALQGHVTTPAGAQDFQVVPEEGGWRVEPRNWVDQERDGS